MSLLLTIFLIFIGFVKNNDAQCGDYAGTECKSIDECSPIIEKLQNSPRPLPGYIVEELRRLNCGYGAVMPMVCCPVETISMPITSSTTSTSTTTSTTPSTTTSTSTTATTSTTTTSTTTTIPLPPIDNRGPSGNDTENHVNVHLVNKRSCGRILENKLSGGNKTALSEYPWMALLRYDSINGLIFGCGGSLISERYVLTAAHCITKLPASYTLVMVRLGEHNTKTDNDCETIDNETNCIPPVQDILIEEIVSHENYNKPRFANDVGLIRLAKSADMSAEYVQPICLPTTVQAQKTVLRRLTVTGWGTTEKGQSSDELLQISVPFVALDRCQTIHRNTRLTPGQMCAGGEVGVDSCQGDSGGPLAQPALVSRSLSVRYVQYGIVSAGGTECSNRTSTPGIYASVTFYMKWILDNLRS